MIEFDPESSLAFESFEDISTDMTSGEGALTNYTKLRR